MKTPVAKKLPSGAWRCQVMVDGQRVSITAATEKEAVAQAMQVKAGLKAAQRESSPSQMTVGQAIDRYIESKDSVLSPATVAGYKRIREHAFPELMPIKLVLLTQEAVQRAVNKMAREKSPKSVRNAHGLLSAALAAYRPDFILRTTLPQRKRYEPAIPSGDDIGKIMAVAKGTVNELPILLAVWLGLRMSEILGLKWEDVEGEVLHIRRALVDEGEKLTKTYSSQRDLPLPPYIRGLIDAAPRTGDHIIPFTRRGLYSRFQVICKRAGVQHYRFHDLRHINASVMLALGIPNRYAQERMGHATDHMLKTVYQHTMSSEQQHVAQLVDHYFEEKLHTNLHTQ